MTMPLWQGIATVAAVVLGTLVTRFLPFLLFPAGKPTPKFIQYLGRVLPFAVIGLLVIYCLKGVSVTAFPFGLPELIAIILVAVLHYWKSNMLLSIGCGTVVYMLMVQFLFAAYSASCFVSLDFFGSSLFFMQFHNLIGFLFVSSAGFYVPGSLGYGRKIGRTEAQPAADAVSS